MQCKVCQGAASGTCRGCGSTYCAKHGGGSFVSGPICADCFEKNRHYLANRTVTVAGIGAFFLLTGSQSDHPWPQIVMALVFLGAAVCLLWESHRTNPWADRTRDE